MNERRTYRSIVHQDRQSHSLSNGGTRSQGSQKPSRLSTFTIAPIGGSCGVTCASQVVTAQRDDLTEIDIDSESVLQYDREVS